MTPWDQGPRPEDMAPVQWSSAEGIGVITLNRPNRRNALDVSSSDELARLIDVANHDDAVRIVVLRGAGGTFCSGMDLTDMREQPERAVRHFNGAQERMRAGRKPVIAAMSGHCLGAGVQLAVAADLRVADTTGRIGVPAVRLGIIYPAESVDDLVRTAGPAAATALLLGGEPLSAERAYGLGLVHFLERETTAFEAAMVLADRMQCFPTPSLVATKAQLRAAVAGGASGSADAAAWASQTFSAARLEPTGPSSSRAVAAGNSYASRRR